LDERRTEDDERWYEVRVTTNELGKPRIFTFICPPGSSATFKLNGGQLELLVAVGAYEGTGDDSGRLDQLKVGASLFYTPLGLGGHYFGPIEKIEPKAIDPEPWWVSEWKERREVPGTA
jgi:hypothetical protein